MNKNMRKTYRNSVPVNFGFNSEHMPQINYESMTHQIYYNDNSYEYYKHPADNKYTEGIYIGKLSFTINDENIEENEYTGNAPTKVFTRNSDSSYHQKRKRLNTAGLNSNNFFIPKQQKAYQTASQPIKKEEMDALKFLLGSQNPFVLQSQQQQEAQTQNESLEISLNKAPTTKTLPLLEDILNLKSSVVNPLPTVSRTNSILSLNFAMDKLLTPNSQNEALEHYEGTYWKTPEKRNSFNDLSETSEKVNELELSTASSESVSRSDNKSLPEDCPSHKHSGKSHKKLKFKPYEHGKHSSTYSHESKAGDSKSQRPSQSSVLNFDIDNNELFPSLLEANKPSQRRN